MSRTSAAWPECRKLFVEAGLIVLVSFISPYRAERMLARDCVEDGEFVEIFVDTPVKLRICPASACGTDPSILRLRHSSTRRI